MNTQCKGQWHDYPNCEGCPMLGDSCDGSEEHQDKEEEATDLLRQESLREDLAVEQAAEDKEEAND